MPFWELPHGHLSRPIKTTTAPCYDPTTSWKSKWCLIFIGCVSNTKYFSHNISWNPYTTLLINWIQCHFPHFTNKILQIRKFPCGCIAVIIGKRTKYEWVSLSKKLHVSLCKFASSLISTAPHLNHKCRTMYKKTPTVTFFQNKYFKVPTFH